MKKINLLILFLAIGIFASAQQEETQKQEKFDINQYFNLSLTQTQRQDIYKNIKKYSEAIKANSTEAVNYLNRGKEYAKLGMYPDAISDYNKAINLNSNLAAAYYYRGLAKARFHYTKRSCADMLKAANLGMEDAHSTYDSHCGLYKASLEHLEQGKH